MSDFASDSDDDNDGGNQVLAQPVVSAAEEEANAVEFAALFPGRVWNEEIKLVSRGERRRGHGESVLRDFLRVAKTADTAALDLVRDRLSERLNQFTETMIMRWGECVQILENPNEYRKDRAKKQQRSRDMPHLLRHMFVHSGAERAPPEVLERYFEECDRGFARNYPWSEYFSPGPEFGSTAREREAHIVAARKMDEKRRFDADTILIRSQLNAILLLGEDLWRIVLTFVPYARNLVPLTNSSLAKASCLSVAKRWPVDATQSLPFKRVELANSHNMGNPGNVLRRVSDNSPVRLPSHRFVGKINVNGNVAWVCEWPGDVATWTFHAPGVMFALDLESLQVVRTLPCYDQGQDDNGEQFPLMLPTGGGQLFSFNYRREIHSHVNYTNLDAPLGVYFSDSFAPPRYQSPPVHWTLDPNDPDVVYLDKTTHRLSLCFGAPLDAPPYLIPTSLK
jgi:hypothetical protein